MSGWDEDNIDELTGIIKSGIDSISGSLEEMGGAFALLNHRVLRFEDQVERMAHALGTIAESESMSFLADELHKIFEPIGNLHMSIADDIAKIANEMGEENE